MTQETQTPQAAAMPRGDAPTLTAVPAELTDVEMALVVGGTDGLPTGAGTGHGVPAKASPILF